MKIDAPWTPPDSRIWQAIRQPIPSGFWDKLPTAQPWRNLETTGSSSITWLRCAEKKFEEPVSSKNCVFYRWYSDTSRTCRKSLEYVNEKGVSMVNRFNTSSSPTSPHVSVFCHTQFQMEKKCSIPSSSFLLWGWCFWNRDGLLEVIIPSKNPKILNHKSPTTCEFV